MGFKYKNSEFYRTCIILYLIKLTNFEMIKKIIREEGFSGYYKGFLPSVFLTINPIIQYIIYEFLKSKMIDANGIISSKNIIIISAFSKFVTTYLTYPALTIKTLYQANENKTAGELKDLIINMVKNNGFLYLYKGNFIYYLFIFIFK